MNTTSASAKLFTLAFDSPRFWAPVRDTSSCCNGMLACSAPVRPSQPSASTGFPARFKVSRREAGCNTVVVSAWTPRPVSKLSPRSKHVSLGQRDSANSNRSRPASSSAQLISRTAVKVSACRLREMIFQWSTITYYPAANVKIKLKHLDTNLSQQIIDI